MGALAPTRPVWEWLRRVVIDHDAPIPERIDTLNYAPSSPAILRARRTIRAHLIELATPHPITTLTAHDIAQADMLAQNVGPVTSTAGAEAGAYAGPYAGPGAGASGAATAGAPDNAAAAAIAPTAAALGNRPPAPNWHGGPDPGQPASAPVDRPSHYHGPDPGMHIRTTGAGASVRFAAPYAVEDAASDDDACGSQAPPTKTNFRHFGLHYRSLFVARESAGQSA